MTDPARGERMREERRRLFRYVLPQYASVADDVVDHAIEVARATGQYADTVMRKLLKIEGP